MKTYFATCIEGFSEVISETLQKDISDIRIMNIFESSVLFQTTQEYKDIISRIYLNNVFVVLNSFPLEKEWMDGSLAKALHKDVEYKKILQSDPVFQGTKSMRIMVQKGSKLVHIPRQISKKIVAEITVQTRLQHNPLQADVEFWFLIRNEQFAVLGVKPTRVKATAYQESKDGKLRPKLAHILNLLSEPNKDDVYLDPFAGHGALPWDRMNNFPYAKIYVSDINEKFVRKYDKEYQKHSNIIIKKANAHNLAYLKDESVSKIVTDPPWGLYELKDINYEEFYTAMLKEMYRVIQKNGIIVIVTARIAEFEQALVSYAQQFACVKQIQTLVNGKKVTVYKLLRQK